MQSSDYGNVYKLPNVGGVPEVTLDAKAAILKSVEEDFAKTFGNNIELAEVLKPSTELRKPGAVAKLELTGQKTGKAAMVDAGMPADALGEAGLWKPKVKPQEIPGFKNLSESRKAAAIKEYENALKANAEWRNPAPGSKTAKLKQLIGKEGTVPLDDKPWPGGLQRFVNAEFELVKVPGKYADAFLIRVKKYELVVKDMARGGKVVNTKTVVNSTKALAQGVDADAVAMMKVVGRDAAGKPILGPLSASERSFVMNRYIDRNIKARAAGLVTDLAEHGATLIMDDADALHAGFLPAEVRRAVHARRGRHPVPAAHREVRGAQGREPRTDVSEHAQGRAQRGRLWPARGGADQGHALPRRGPAAVLVAPFAAGDTPPRPTPTPFSARGCAPRSGSVRGPCARCCPRRRCPATRSCSDRPEATGASGSTTSSPWR